MLQLYTNIKSRRQELHLTQTELAKKLGYADKSMIAKIEKGLVDLSQSKIMAFADALDTTAGDLMGWDDPSPAKDPTSLQHLTDNFDKLNEEGQEKLVDYSDDLIASGRYIKNDEFKALEEEA